MADLLDVPLREFQADLDRLKQLLHMVISLRDFATVDVVAGDSTFSQSAVTLGKEIRSLSADLPVLSGTLLLYLAGRFEHFTRSSFQAHCDSLAQKCKKFAQLPKRMQKSLRQLTAEVAINPGKFNYDDVSADSFVVALASNVTAVNGLGRVNSECLSVTSQNMRPKMLQELYARLGLVDVWGEVAKQAPLKAFLQLEKDNECGVEARSRLEEMMETRNQVAHPNGTPTFPGPEKVQRWLDYVEVLAATITSVSRANIAYFRPAE